MNVKTTSSSLGFGLALGLLFGCSSVQQQLAVVTPASKGPAATVEQGPLPAASTGGTNWAYQEEPLTGAPTSPYLERELLVSLQPGSAEAEILAKLPGATVLERLVSPRPLLRLSLPPGVSPQLASRTLAGVAGVRYATLNRPVRTSYTFAPNTEDVHYAQQWAHQANHANTQGAWDLLASVPNATASQNRVIVAVVDTGCDVGHPDLAARLEPGYNATAENATCSLSPLPASATESNVLDLVGHGTHVTGIVAAAGGNGMGVAGVAWNARVLPVKVLGLTGGSTFDVVKGMYYAAGYQASDGARVRIVNMSLGQAGMYHPPVAEEEAVDYLYSHGIVTVVAAGNDAGLLTAPANTSRCVAVSSISSSMGYEFLSGFSNYGWRLDVTAPGGAIWSTIPRHESMIGGTNPSEPYAMISGTSMAAPYVSGVAALIVARYASESIPATQTAEFAAKVIARLQQSADDLGEPGRDALYGYGRVNALQAIGPSSLDALP